MAIHKKYPHSALRIGRKRKLALLELTVFFSFRWDDDPELCLGLVNVPTYALLVAVPICLALNYLLVLGP